jgi:hypothetical protein
MSYKPKYVTIDDVPVASVPDDYTSEEKRQALQFAEGKLELDVNDGNRINLNSLVQPMEVAVQYLSTYQLTLGAEDVDSVTLSDLSDDGSNKTDYANEYLRMYNNIVSSINDSDSVLSDSDSHQKEYVYTTEEPDEDWNDIPYDEPRFVNNDS